MHIVYCLGRFQTALFSFGGVEPSYLFGYVELCSLHAREAAATCRRYMHELCAPCTVLTVHPRTQERES